MLLALCVLLGGPPAEAAVRQRLDASVQRRVTATSGDGPESAAFEEFGEKPGGFILERYGVEAAAGPLSLEAWARRPGLDDQSVSLELGVPGRWSCQAAWDKTPHLYSRQARSLWSERGGGALDFPDALQAYYQSVDVSTSVNPGQNFNDPTSTAGIRNVLRSAPYVPLAVSLETASLDLRLRAWHDLVVELGGLHQTRRGARPQGAGFGFNNAVELAAPVDQAAREAYARAQLAKRSFQLGAEYRFSEFRNALPALYFDNPKRLDDRAVGTHIVSGDGGAHGAIAQAPGNTAHSLRLEGGLDLSERWRLSGEAGYRLWRQQEGLLPYTQNSAMSNTNPIPEGIYYYTPPFAASDPSKLPAARADGRIEVTSYMGRLSGRPFERLRAALTHDAYILENGSRRDRLPGFAVADQTWYGVAVLTPAQQFRRDKTALKTDWKLGGGLSAQLGAAHTYVKRTREVSKSREDEAGAGLTLRRGGALVGASALASRRRGGGFELGSLPTALDSAGRRWYTQAPGLRRPDVADRDRREGRLRAQWTAGEATASLNGRVTKDVYRPSGPLDGNDPLVAAEFFGTLWELQETAGADVSVPVTESLSADAYCELEYAHRRIRSVIFNHAWESGGTGNAWVQAQLPDNRWGARVLDRTQAGGLSLTWRPAAALKTTLGYDLMFTRQDVDPVENGLGAGELLAFKNFPTARKTLQTLRGRMEYRLTRYLTLAATGLYERFDADDWGLGDVPLRDLNDSAIYLGRSLRDARAYSLSLGAMLEWGGP